MRVWGILSLFFETLPCLPVSLTGSGAAQEWLVEMAAQAAGEGGPPRGRPAVVPIQGP